MVATDGGYLPEQCRRCGRALGLGDWSHIGRAEADEEAEAVLRVERRRLEGLLAGLWGAALARLKGEGNRGATSDCARS